MTYKLKDKVAVVAGSSRGIDWAIAERLAFDSAAIVVNYVVHDEAARAVIAAIKAGGGRATIRA
jgi:3-oxoacyl-[acyl-carrier protein] reductase